MKGKIVIAVLAVIVVILVVGFLINSSSSRNSSISGPASMSSSAGTASGTTAQSKVKLSDTQFANNAYLISGDTLDDNTKVALSGFGVQRTVQSDGSVIITLKALNPEYQDQNYTVQPGQKLYFIEGSMGDDSPPNGENNLGDDRAVLVDADGYIVTN